MAKKEEEEKELIESEDLIIKKEEGLTISYHKEELEKNYPHLMAEIGKRSTIVKIDSIEYDIDKKESEEQDSTIKLNEKELSDPGVLDFLRRCSSNEEAYEILDYLLKRNELSKKNYNMYIKYLEEENGLEKLISQSGGFKEPGYYLRKYYYPNLKKNGNNPPQKSKKHNSE